MSYRYESVVVGLIGLDARMSWMKKPESGLHLVLAEIFRLQAFQPLLEFF
jgi:hypothetical protein